MARKPSLISDVAARGKNKKLLDFLLSSGAPKVRWPAIGNGRRRRRSSGTSSLAREGQGTNSKMIAAPGPPEDNQSGGDPFLYFSSDKRRIEHLLGRELSRMPPDDGPAPRKTRISFELDPLFDAVNSDPEFFGYDPSSGEPSGDS